LGHGSVLVLKAWTTVTLIGEALEIQGNPAPNHVAGGYENVGWMQEDSSVFCVAGTERDLNAGIQESVLPPVMVEPE